MGGGGFMHGSQRERPRRRGPGRLPLGYQVIAGVAALLALVAVAAVTALVLVIGMKDAAADNERSRPFDNAVQVMALDAETIAADERGFLLTGHTAFAVDAIAQTAATRSAFATAAASARTPAERTSMTDARQRFDTWIDMVTTNIASYESGDRSAAIASSVGTDSEVRRAYEAELSAAGVDGDRLEASTSSSVHEWAERSVTIMATCLVLELLAGIAVGYWLVRSVAMPVYRLVSLLSSDG